MFFRSFFDENLAHMSYLIGCQRTGEAIVVDPARNIEPYLDIARKEGLTITAATETHIHADFLSGARQLAKECGATLYLSDEGDEKWKYQYLSDVKHVLLKEGCVIRLGNVEFKVMHTPGHTPESISFILTDTGGGSTEPMGIFSGDFVFVGDIGRPDLLEKAARIAGTADAGAKQMFQSLKKFKALPDFLQVWPAHGAGSACGKSLGAVPVSTVGYEKRNNWALQVENEEEFINMLLAGQPEPPKYFAMMKHLNKEGPELAKNEDIPVFTSSADVEKYVSSAVIIDTRASADFAKAHYNGSINIPFNKSFTNWAGWFVTYDQEIVLIALPQDVPEIRKALASIGLDRLIGAIDPSTVLADSANVESYEEISVYELGERLKDDNNLLIDVRNQSEWDEGSIPGATHIMLGTLTDRLNELPKDKVYIMQCHSGGRSAIAVSLLQAAGYRNVLNLKGGYLAWMKKKVK